MISFFTSLCATEFELHLLTSSVRSADEVTVVVIEEDDGANGGDVRCRVKYASRAAILSVDINNSAKRRRSLLTTVRRQ